MAVELLYVLVDCCTVWTSRYMYTKVHSMMLVCIKPKHCVYAVGKIRKRESKFVRRSIISTKAPANKAGSFSAVFGPISGRHVFLSNQPHVVIRILQPQLPFWFWPSAFLSLCPHLVNVNGFARTFGVQPEDIKNS